MVIKVPQQRKGSLFFMQNIQIYINIYMETLIRFLETLVLNTDKYSRLVPLMENVKKEDMKNRLGFSVSRDVYPMLKLLERHSLTSVCELGAGMGVFLKALTDFTWNELRVGGIELEPLFVEISKLYLEIDVKNGNLLRLTREDIIEYECLYTNEPFKSSEFTFKFFDNLFNQMVSGQFLIYKPQSDFYKSIYNDPRMRFVEDTIYFQVFMKK